MGYSVISEGLVLIAAVVAATSMAMAVISNLQQLQELQSSIVRDLRDRAATKLAVVAVIESPSQPGQVFRVYLKNVGLRELTLAELQKMTAMIVSNSWAGVLRYSADGSPGTWSIEGEVRTVLRGETFVIRLHMPTSLGKGEHVLRLVLPNGSFFEEVFST
jgi:archaellum component FlaG (FlaF/FlaG flagellin family)